MTQSRRERVLRTKQAYENTFCGENGQPHPEAQRVLADLRNFCGITKGGIVVNRTQGGVDPYATIYRAALRDVYLRIQGFLSLDEKSLFEEPRDEHSRADT